MHSSITAHRSPLSVVWGPGHMFQGSGGCGGCTEHVLPTGKQARLAESLPCTYFPALQRKRPCSLADELPPPPPPPFSPKDSEHKLSRSWCKGSHLTQRGLTEPAGHAWDGAATEPLRAQRSLGALRASGLCPQTLLPSNPAPAAEALLAVKAGKTLRAAFRPDLNRDPLASVGSVWLGPGYVSP